jgi:hypothetical protein
METAKHLIFYLIVTLGLIKSMSCNPKPSLTNTVSNSKHRQARSFEESPLPDKIIQAYLKKINLGNIDGGINNLEIRVWGSFTKDSFPVVLERYFVEKGKLIGEVFFLVRNLIMQYRTLKQLMIMTLNT